MTKKERAEAIEALKTLYLPKGARVYVLSGNVNRKAAGGVMRTIVVLVNLKEHDVDLTNISLRVADAMGLRVDQGWTGVRTDMYDGELVGNLSQLLYGNPGELRIWRLN